MTDFMLLVGLIVGSVLVLEPVGAICAWFIGSWVYTTFFHKEQGGSK